ncbi:FAD-dependent oxidoreductase [Aliidiomarina minuta]|uniref:FAD-dependent oxidoreductase n=1 Tax=Aliidiomarina minuta TaxID=880057 RepID=A0A432W6J0_9GAMM|nr:FAD-dependent oxidoreductase [Aliidiomarina minuta]RUO25599.1 FAD-dependent oxidoreductase [Aliidiomarina minuta]
MKIAVVGSGISGLTTAYLLHKEHEVEVFEANDYIGGHTATVDIEESDGSSLAIDTGFIVFNDRTYPRFRHLMRELGVAWQDAEMSFSVHNPDTGLEYNGHTLGSMFAQKRNYFRPSFYRMLADILRFNKAAKKALQEEGAALDERTLDDFVNELNVGSLFRGNYLYPMCAAIWSASLQEAARFPLGFFLRFFMNHGLLNVQDRPQWAVIKGGSRSYIPALTAGFKDNIYLNCRIQSITRSEQGVQLHLGDGSIREFDEVVLACHSDQALQLLADPSEAESGILGAIPYQPNEVVLHTDTNLLPKRRAAWASWNYLLPKGEHKTAQLSSVTYDMNILQSLDTKQTYCVTLNNTAMIDDSKILRRFVYQHPVYSLQSLAARARRTEICGQNRTHFCGAYWYNGFHEDGVHSAFDVAHRFNLMPRVAELEQD